MHTTYPVHGTQLYIHFFLYLQTQNLLLLDFSCWIPMGIPSPLQEDRPCSAVTRYAAVNTRKYSSSCQDVAHRDATHLATQAVSADDLGLHGLCRVGLDTSTKTGQYSPRQSFSSYSTMIFYF